MLLQCEGVTVARRLAPFSASAKQGELIHLLGPNGAGKSSLLTCLSGLLPAQGQILFNGRPLAEWSGTELACHRAWLAQQQQPVSNMPVWHYLSLHLTGSTPADEQTVMAICDTLQLKDKLARPLSQLSGGEWQRVRLAAVFGQMAQPEGQLLLLDEPLSGLDLAQQAAFDRYLQSRVAAGLTVIMSGHDINHSLHNAQRVWLLKNGELVQQGSASEVLQPEILSVTYGVSFRRLAVEGHEMLTTFL
ncbi:vitamin B12 ABC transporter ATP-binding protein BtuD [Pantoea sp. BAV 3049]|uniref:vitamin B12 ABC transporter ATP-binding protein BtuD n=1 Tax=Pantoea sp. BAV 3049 TaxID=2654188 RepID=UPI00131AE436|nr:vitamin B12 ABC transporter ATP-binding protein BtuD [Pantoea sp. BAV 3049]